MCFEDLLKFVKVSIALALRGGEYGEIAPKKQMDMLQEAEVYTMPLRRMAGDATSTSVMRFGLSPPMAAQASQLGWTP